MASTLSSNDRSWQELAHILRTEWEGGAVDRQRVLDLAGQLLPDSPDMRHTLTHLAQRMAAQSGKGGDGRGYRPSKAA